MTWSIATRRRTAVVIATVATALAACGDSVESDPGGTGSGGHGGAGATSTGSGTSSGGCGDHDCTCQCNVCEAESGVCDDGCIDSLGCGTKVCYHPTTPAAGQFSCDGLITCDTGEVCYFAAPGGEGCSEHSCVPVPAGCENDPTCACITQVAQVTCTEDDGGPRVVGNLTPPWLQ